MDILDNIRVAILEDNRIMREGIMALMEPEEAFSLIATELNIDSILILKDFNPHIILMDFTLQEEFNLLMIEEISEELPDAKIVIMDLAPIQPEIIEYIKSGVSGFVLKGTTFEDFLKTLRTVALGQKVLPAPLMGTLFAQIVNSGIKKESALRNEGIIITNREQEVVNLIAKGLRNKEIAKDLNLSVDTIKSHVHNILKKLSLDNRTQIASYINAYKNF